jgi:hypothetical protein
MVSLILVALVLSGHLSLADQSQTEGRQGPTKENTKENLPSNHPLKNDIEPPNAKCGDEKIEFNSPFIAVVGEPFSEQVGTFKICHGNIVIQWGSQISWGDGERSPGFVPDPFWQGRW